MKVIVGSDAPHYTRSVGQFDNRMAYALALHQLGHEVLTVAEVHPERCFDEAWNPVTFTAFPGRREFADLARQYSDRIPHALVYDGGAETDGLSFDEIVDWASETDVLINLGGKLRTREVLDRVGCRILVDLAPGKTQVYASRYGMDLGLDRHDLFFTVGRNIGRPDCPIPTCGVEWRPWMHPVPLPQWPACTDPSATTYSTITGWAGKETFELDGRYSGEKSTQWLTFADLPSRVTPPLEVAARITEGYEDDARLLEEGGWLLSDPGELRRLADYRAFIQRSRGEFTIANQRYTEFRSGWFSERSARYLASGKPVVMQDTGFVEHVGADAGILTFRTIDEAVAALERLEDDYLTHARNARRTAEEHFDGRELLSSMLAVAAGGAP